MSVRMILVLLFNTVSTILDRTIATVTIQHPDHVSCFRYVYDNIHVHTHTHAHTHKQAHTLKHNTRTYNVTLKYHLTHTHKQNHLSVHIHL